MNMNILDLVQATPSLIATILVAVKQQISEGAGRDGNET
jgi:hypothetical protein